MSGRSTEQIIKDLRWLGNVMRGVSADRAWVQSLALEAAAALALKKESASEARDGCGRERSDRVATPESNRRPASMAREEALEEAAKVIEKKHTNNVGMVHPMAESDAAAIRSLKSEGTPPKDRGEG